MSLRRQFFIADITNQSSRGGINLTTQPQQQQQWQLENLPPLQQQQQQSASTPTTNLEGDGDSIRSPSTRRGTAVPDQSDIVGLTLSVVGDDTQGHEDVTGMTIDQNDDRNDRSAPLRDAR